MQKFVEKEKGVFVSDKIVFLEDGKTVNKILGESVVDIAPEWPLTLFRYMPFSRLYTDINEKTLTFVSPKQWDDPFESAFLDINQSLNTKCLCFTYNGSIGEDWAWRSYKRDEQLVRIEILFDRIIDTLSKIVCHENFSWSFYISVCDYTKDKKTIISYVKESRKNLGIDDYLNIMSLKRKAFSTEKEIRIFAVSKKSLDDGMKIFENVDYKKFVTRVMLEPLAPFQDNPRSKYYSKLQDIHNAGISDYISSLKIEIQQSRLYEIR